VAGNSITLQECCGPPATGQGRQQATTPLMQPIEILGYIAGTMSSVVFLPQVIKTWKTKSATDISLVMFLFATASVVLWLIYGIIIRNGSIIYTNSTVLLLSCVMLYFKIRYK
jgi:MtN3 and saliva related transmembrane protein